MDPKITRRAVLGTIIGGLLAGPFVIRAFRGNREPLPVGEESVNAKFRKYFDERVSFPREYNGVASNAPPEKRGTIERIHKRFWANYAKIDEVSFWYSSHCLLDGKERDIVWFMDARVHMKYGYGMEVKGKNVKGKDIHLVFNLDGTVKLPKGVGADLSSMMLSMFDAQLAHPWLCVAFFDYEKNAKLPPNSGISDSVLSDMPCHCLIKKNNSDHTWDEIQERWYFSDETGMLVLSFCEDPYVLKNFGHYSFTRYEYTKCNDVFLPTLRIVDYPNKKNLTTDKFSDYEVKLV